MKCADSLVVGLLASASICPFATAWGQVNSSRNTHSASHTATSSSTPTRKYLVTGLNLTESNVGLNFHGHDIIAVFKAVEKSPALKEKGEFESSSTFETRRAGFLNRPFYGDLSPNDYFGFVVPSGDIISSPEFKYDADTQTLAITLEGHSKELIEFKKLIELPITEYVPHLLDTILIRRTAVNHGKSYMASNAFGAKVRVHEASWDEYGIAFEPASWLFPSPSGSPSFTYKLKMTPDEARALEPYAKLMLICRLAEPWLKSSAGGGDATFDEPYQNFVGEKYLVVNPEQLWLFNVKTGEVVRKLSASSVPRDEDTSNP